MSNEKAICLLSLKMPIISLRCQAFKTKNIDPKGKLSNCCYEKYSPIEPGLPAYMFSIQ